MKSLYLFIFVLLSVPSHGQVNPLFLEPTKKQADSLRLALQQDLNDTLRMAAYRELSLFYLDINSDTALSYAERDLPLAQKLQLKLWEGDAWDLIAITTYAQGNYVKSLRAYNEALRITKDNACEKGIWRISRFTNSAQPEFARLSMLGTIQSDLVSLYSVTKNYQQELSTLNDCIRTASRINDPTLLSQAYRLLGTIHFRNEHLDSALVLFKLSLDYSAKAGYRKYRNQNYGLIGNIYLRQKSINLAVQNYHNALQSSIQENNKSGIGDAYLQLARLYNEVRLYDSALYYGKASLLAHRNTGRTPNIINAYGELTLIYKNLNKPDSALAYLQLATAAKDSLLSLEKIKQLQNIGFDEQQRLYEMEVAQKDLQNTLRTNILLGSTFTLVVVAFFLYRNNRTKQKAKQKIEEAYDQLKSTQSQLIQSEKMASLGELTAGIAHEIQNPLNFVNNFAEVNSELISEMKDALDNGSVEEARSIARTLEENEVKIVSHGKRADAIVKGMLQHSRKSTGQKEPTDINALCDEYLRLAYHGLRAKDKSFNAKFETHLDPALPKVNVVPQDIGRVILNLINNAFYACTERSRSAVGQQPKAKGQKPDTTFEPTVIVSTRRLGSKIEISVKDNGPGIPAHIKDKIFQPFFTTKPTGQGTGLGLSLSYDIITKGHGGELKVDTKEGEGSVLTIILPA